MTYGQCALEERAAREVRAVGGGGEDAGRGVPGGLSRVTRVAGRERAPTGERAAADSAVCTVREIQERLSRQFRALDEAGDVDGLVKVGALLAKVTGAEGATRVEVRDGGVTADYRPPPAVARLGDEELRGLLLDEP